MHGVPSGKFIHRLDSHRANEVLSDRRSTLLDVEGICPSGRCRSGHQTGSALQGQSARHSRFPLDHRPMKDPDQIYQRYQDLQAHVGWTYEALRGFVAFSRCSNHTFPCWSRISTPRSRATPRPIKSSQAARPRSRCRVRAPHSPRQAVSLSLRMTSTRRLLGSTLLPDPEGAVIAA
jgi:hypothetical protein